MFITESEEAPRKDLCGHVVSSSSLKVIYIQNQLREYPTNFHLNPIYLRIIMHCNVAYFISTPTYQLELFIFVLK